MSCAKIAQPIKMPFWIWTLANTTEPSIVAAMRPVVKLLLPPVVIIIRTTIVSHSKSRRTLSYCHVVVW